MTFVYFNFALKSEPAPDLTSVVSTFNINLKGPYVANGSFSLIISDLYIETSFVQPGHLGRL